MQIPKEEIILFKVKVVYMISLILKCRDGHHWLRPEPIGSGDVNVKVIPVKQRRGDQTRAKQGIMGGSIYGG